MCCRQQIGIRDRRFRPMYRARASCDPFRPLANGDPRCLRHPMATQAQPSGLTANVKMTVGFGNCRAFKPQRGMAPGNPAGCGGCAGERPAWRRRGDVAHLARLPCLRESRRRRQSEPALRLGSGRGRLRDIEARRRASDADLKGQGRQRARTRGRHMTLDHGRRVMAPGKWQADATAIEGGRRDIPAAAACASRAADGRATALKGPGCPALRAGQAA